MNNNNPNFLAGLEEAISRILSMLVLVVVFGVYYFANGDISLNWFTISGVLLLFWFVYELLSYGFFILFAFVAQSKNKSLDTNQKSDSDSL